MIGLALKTFSERLFSGTGIFRTHARGVKHRFSPFERDLWRVNIRKNQNKHKALLDGPDYTFLDKRPVPLGTRQFGRLKEQQGYAAKVKELVRELDMAKENYAKLQQEKQNSIQAILDKKLKPKGGFITTKQGLTQKQ